MTLDIPPGTPGPDAPTEPLISVGTVTTLAATILALLVTFGIHLSDDTQATLLTLIGILAPIIVTLVGRTKVFSPKTVRTLVTQAATRRQP